MRVAVIHSLYRSGSPSGENVAVEQQILALERSGIEVFRVLRATDDESQKPFYKLRSLIHLGTGIQGGGLVRQISNMKVDLVNVHNLWPNFGTRWLRELEVPVVSTLHNFRYACANGLLFRDGYNCTDCIKHGSYKAFQHRCYQNSFAASLPAALATIGGASGNPLLQKSSLIISQAERANHFLVEQGLPESKLRLVPGFVERRNKQTSTAPDENRFVFVGRDTPEKGLSELIRLWPSGVHLDVFGARSGMTMPPSKRIALRGIMNREELLRLLPRYSALVFPGLAWEGAYPLVVREALEAGVPVVAREGTGASDLIHASGAGSIYRGGHEVDLLRALQHVSERNSQLRLAARAYFEEHLTEDRWVRDTTQVFQEALQG